MKVLILAGDHKICIPGSPARKRMEEYAGLFDELHVVVPAAPETAEKEDGKLFLHPARAGNPVMRRWRVYGVARDVAAKIRFDCITVQGPDEVGFMAYRIARRFGAKLQIQVHTDILSPWYRRASWKEYMRYRLARYLLPRADCIRAVSERIKRSLVTELHIPDSRISVLPIFTDLTSFRDASPKPEDSARLRSYSFRMIAVGRFVDKEKNFSMLIRIMTKLAKKEPHVVLFLVGDGPDKKNFKFQISNFRLERNVIIEPWRDDLASFYKCFDVALISSNYEGWGLVVIEAMVAGVPVVMTDVGLAGEVVKDGINGRVAPVGDEAAFYDALLDLCRHPEKQHMLAEAARRTVAEMKPRTQEEYLEMYRRSFERCIT